MAIRPSLRPTLAIGATLALVTLHLGGAVDPVAAAVAPSQSVASVQAQVTQLDADLQAATTRLEAATRTADDAEARLQQLELEVAATRARYDSARERAGQLAAASYRSGAIQPGVLRLVSAEEPADVLAQVSTLSRVMERQGTAMERVAAIEVELSSDKDTLAAEFVSLDTARRQVEEEKVVIEAKAAEVRRLLASVETAERTRIEDAQRAAADEVASARALGATASRSARNAPGVPGAPGSSAPVPVVTDCAPSGSRGAEARLTPTTLGIMRCGLEAFPAVEYAGGWGTRGNPTDHDDGRAVDFMIPGYRSDAGNDLGWAVAEWASKQPGVDYVLFDSRMFRGWAPARGWEPVSNRGSDTANHRDHVHVSVSG